MNQYKQKRFKRIIRHHRVRTRVSGTAERPRLSVFRSNQHIYAQIIDDTLGKTLVAASSLEVKERGKKSEVAKAVGRIVAQKAVAKHLTRVVFDKGGYKYHGRVKALAEGAREGGLIF